MNESDNWKNKHSSNSRDISYHFAGFNYSMKIFTAQLLANSKNKHKGIKINNHNFHVYI